MRVVFAPFSSGERGGFLRAQAYTSCRIEGMSNVEPRSASIDEVDFSGIKNIRIRDLTHPQNGWEMSANDVSVWCEITLNGEDEQLEVFITDRPQ